MWSFVWGNISRVENMVGSDHNTLLRSDSILASTGNISVLALYLVEDIWFILMHYHHCNFLVTP